MVATNNSAPKGKEKTDTNKKFAAGGSNKMFGPGGAAPQEPGVTARRTKAGDNTFKVNGGKGKMFGKQAADPQAPGSTAHQAGTSQNWGLPKGKGHMSGPNTAKNASPR